MDHAAAYSGGSMYLENCRIRYDIEIKDAGSAVYGHNLRSWSVKEAFAVLEIDGSQYITLEAAGLPW